MADDIFLYTDAGDGNITLWNPTTPRGMWPGTSAFTQNQIMQASGSASNWGIVLYPMGQLLTLGAASFRPVGSPVVRRIDL